MVSMALVAGIIVVIVIIAAAGVFVVKSGSGSKQAGASTTVSPTPTTSVSSGNSGGSGTNHASTSVAPQTVTPQSINATMANLTATLAYYGKGCDLSGVTQIVTTISNKPGYNMTEKLSNSNVTQMTIATGTGQPETTNFNGSMQKSGNIELSVLCAVSGASTSFDQIAQESGGNTNGKWFTATYNGVTGYFNIDATNPTYLSLEERIPGITINGTKFNDVFLLKMTVLKRTHSLASLATFYIPGSDPMTSEPFQTVMNNANSTANMQVAYNMMLAYDPGLAAQSGGFSAYENMSRSSETSSIGWENYTYTFK